MSLQIILHEIHTPNSVACWPGFKLPIQFAVRVSLHDRINGNFYEKTVRRSADSGSRPRAGTPAASVYEQCDYVQPVLSPIFFNGNNISHEFIYNIPSLLHRFQESLLSVQLYSVERFGYRLVCGSITPLSRGRISLDLPAYYTKLKKSVRFNSISEFKVPPWAEKPIKQVSFNLTITLAPSGQSQPVTLTPLTTRSTHPLLKEHVMRKIRFFNMSGGAILRLVPPAQQAPQLGLTHDRPARTSRILISDGRSIEIYSPDAPAMPAGMAKNASIVNAPGGESPVAIVKIPVESTEQQPITDITVLNSTTIIYAISNRIYIKSLQIPEQFFKVRDISIPVPIASLSSFYSPDGTSVLVGGAFDGSLRIWDLEDPLRRREAKFLDAENPMGVMLLKSVGIYVYAVALDNVLYKVKVDVPNLKMLTRGQFKNDTLIIRGLDASEDMILLLDHNLNSIVMDAELNLLFGIKNPILPEKPLPLPIIPCIVDSENLLIPRLYGFDHVCLTGGHPSISRYETVKSTGELVRSILTTETEQIYVGSYPSKTLFATALPHAPLQHYRAPSGDSTFVIKRSNGYQGIYDIPILKPNQKRAARRAELAKANSPGRHGQLGLVMTY